MNMWNQRYDTQTYVYGTEANDFLAENSDALSPGRALCLAEGEGRNAAWLAQQGFEVTAVDASEVGLSKARQLAETRGLEINIVHSDLEQYQIAENHWDVIISIFCHLPPVLRKKVHRQCVKGLRRGGVMLLEAYTPAQLEYKTGGPPTINLMMDADTLKEELAGLEFKLLQEVTREIHEGELHRGTGAVVQMLAYKT